MMKGMFKNPITQKRIRRFKEVKRAYLSLCVLIGLYLIGLGSELISNSNPLYVRFNNRSYFPVIKFYPEDIFARNGKKTRPDYKKLNTLSVFKRNPDNFMIFPPIPYGPFESIDPASIEVSDYVAIVFTTMPMIGTVNIKKDYSIARSVSYGSFVGMKDGQAKGLDLNQFFLISDSLKQAIESRFKNLKAPFISEMGKRFNGGEFAISLSTFTPRKRPPKTVRLTFREVELNSGSDLQKPVKLFFQKNLEIDRHLSNEENDNFWNTISSRDREMLSGLIQGRFFGPVDSVTLTVNNRRYIANFIKEDVRFPFAPVRGHMMGIDGAGRDVLARVLYGLRTSLTFGLMLVAFSVAMGIIAGALQGYYGGILDITGQRVIEIWSALPFLYIMILMGSIYGRSFSLLLFIYGLFNWIGISYYIRAEFLRLRKQPFVESAKCMGISNYKIIFKHILPNAMVPVITFFPFSLVGAIGALAALDYLGFGLPPPTPSWGELLFQAQQYRWAWWLILYPSMVLFIVMLLGVFIGEGVRNAYDPKQYFRLE
ncbi:MAG: ABC transporter permease subunit [Desulfobacterales bacterium]|jgi:microcin C transport system permease protein|nr:ABC transporter permease subunit [Desulfobacterales bacterium]MDP6807563.1 ABC transporter permease subunit [Desulfobacterales bacterium]|tara:strand:- start:17095 stop:18717 length:1623 start_codon:yes stop_codon:yes gene_type:complete